MTLLRRFILRCALALATIPALLAEEPPPVNPMTPTPTPALPAFVEQYLPLTYTSPTGKVLNYRLFVPKGAQSASGASGFPLVLFLHGSGGRGDNNAGQLTDGRPTAASVWVTDEIQQKYPCFILAPQCPKKQTWGGIDFADKKILVTDASSEPMDLTLELLQAITREYPIDRSRIYVTGLSLGGFGTWRAIAQAPGLFAAAVPICGGAHDSVIPILAESRIPVWVFHGDQDTAVSPDFSRHIVRALKDAGVGVKYTEFPGVGHNSWSKTCTDPDLLPWLFGQKRNPAK